MKAGLSALCRFAAPLVLGAFSVASVGCDDSVGGERGEGGSGGGDGNVAPQSIGALDLLLVIDGSGSMGDKQNYLALSVQPFLERIRNPRCVDAAHAPIASQPALDAVCPEGSVREYTPDVTVHVGVVSSNLGSRGTDVCSTMAGHSNNDQGRLISRSEPGTAVNDIPTYQNLGFFAWDPGAKLEPAGESSFETFVGEVSDAIVGVGELGCGFEMPLEAMYRFLVEPEPLASDDILEDRQIDQVLLEQRAAFLRDDSVVQVLLLSDENDASTREDAQGSYFLSPPTGNFMPRARAECATDPSDACCASCIEPTPAGCAGDGACAEPGNPGNPDNFYSDGDPENEINIRTWDMKRRFGIDALYPTSRYVEALTSPTLTLPTGIVANPLFASTTVPRTVLFTAVVGVPWQLVARTNGAGEPDASLGFQNGDEMLAAGTWDRILGNPDLQVLPTDPHMIESPFVRAGVDETDPINGNDYDTGYKDLQYACVFQLPTELQRQCHPDDSGCSTPCNGSVLDKPVCDSVDPYLQVAAGAYPGVRHLQVAKGLGPNALVIPICGLSQLTAEPPADRPGPVGTFIMRAGLSQAAEQTASVLGGVSQ